MKKLGPLAVARLCVRGSDPEIGKDPQSEKMAEEAETAITRGSCFTSAEIGKERGRRVRDSNPGVPTNSPKEFRVVVPVFT